MAGSPVVTEISDEEFQRRTLDVIGREFGLGGLARFLRFYGSNRGDYTRNRDQWLKEVTVDDVVRDIEAKYGPLRP